MNRFNEPFQEDKWINKAKHLEAENAALRAAADKMADAGNKYISLCAPPSKQAVYALNDWQEALEAYREAQNG